MRWFVDGIVGMWLLVVPILQMAGSAGLAQEDMGQIPVGEERSDDYAVRVESQNISVYAVKMNAFVRNVSMRPWV
jgi:hypothetical protein